MGNKLADGFEIRVQGRIGLAKTEIGGAQGVWQVCHGTYGVPSASPAFDIHLGTAECAMRLVQYNRTQLEHISSQ